jgi:hypothetical protein
MSDAEGGNEDAPPEVGKEGEEGRKEGREGRKEWRHARKEGSMEA